MYNGDPRVSIPPPPSLQLAPPLTREFSVVDQVVVVALSGDLTGASAPILRTHLLTLVADDGPDEVIVDLSRILSMDTAGARPLLEAHRLHQRRHGSFRLGEISRAAADFLESHTVFADVLVPYAGFIGSSDWLSQPGGYGTGPGVGSGQEPGS
jgi:anti-anti-sigma factor